VARRAMRSKKICFSIVMFRMEMVAPGIKKETFNLELHDNILTISYDHEDNREGARRDLKYRTSEYNYHSFSRSFSLPETVESEKIQAKYEDGILNVSDGLQRLL
jgi:HSP20 family protein